MHLHSLFVFVLNPTATHALARGAWVTGLQCWSRTGPPPQEPGEEDEG